MAGSAVSAIWGSELSPFSLKLRAICDFAGLPYRWLPADGGRVENYRALWRIERAKRTRTAARFPALDALDEYPLVPYFIEPAGRVLYDSSALARWVDAMHPPAAGPLFPEDPALAFVAQLLDEAFDEFGLYMVHHNRWVISAATNDAGVRLAREFRRVMLPGFGKSLATRFARRQVRRLPYLFSLAPPGFSAGVEPARTPPSRPGWPETQTLLDEAWRCYVDGMEAVLQSQPYVLGSRFTVADASAYGQLSMNLKDPTAADRLRQCAPVTYRWLCTIRDGGHAARQGSLQLSPTIEPLLAIVMRTFVPLMRQNETAYERARPSGETLFNEAAFDRGRALYDGELLGKPFRAVVKTFQVRVWREIRAAWSALPATKSARLIPHSEALES